LFDCLHKPELEDQSVRERKNDNKKETCGEAL